MVVVVIIDYCDGENMVKSLLLVNVMIFVIIKLLIMMIGMMMVRMMMI